MSHENPASLVPGSIHLNRNGDKVFIECVRLKAPWNLRRREEPILGIDEGMHSSTGYSIDGKFDGVTVHYRDLIREYKEPEVYEGYLIVWSDGSRSTRSSLETARLSARDYSHQGRLTWKIIKLTGTEDDDTVSSSDFSPLDHEQCK